jgi:hypothetical protein
MTAWRTPIVRQAETTDTAEKNHVPLANQPDSASARGLAGSIKQLFREVAAAVTSQAAPTQAPKKRRRSSGEDTTRGGFRLSATRTLGRPADRAAAIRQVSSSEANLKNEPPKADFGDGPMSRVELIVWYLDQGGFTMHQIRLLFPDLFEHDAAAPDASSDVWDTPDCLNPWHQHDYDDDFRPAPSDHLYPHL